MEQIRSRPLFCFCGLFLIFSVALTGVPAFSKAIAAVACAVCSVALFILSLSLRRPVLRSAAILLGAFCAASALSFYTFGVRLGGAEKWDSATLDGTITVRSVEFSSGTYGIYRARFEASEENARFGVTLTTRDGGLVPGDVLEGKVELSSLSSGGQYDEKSANLPDGVLMAAEDAGLTYARHDDGFSPSRLIESVRRSIRSRFDGSLSRSASGLCSALLLGDRSDLSPELKRDFSRTGTSHLLAISGLHLSVILFFLGKLYNAFSVRRVLRGISSIVFIIVFAALTGFSASVTRAGLMHIVAAAATLFGRRNDPHTSLALSGTVIVCANGFAVLDPGLWLSLLSAYACIRGSLREPGAADAVGSGSAKDKKEAGAARRFGASALSSVRTTLYITACTLPVTWLVFGEASVVSPLTNLVFIPLVTVFLFFTMIFALTAAAGIPTAPLAALLDLLEWATSRLAGSVSKLKGIVWPVRGGAAGALIFALFAVALIAPLLSGKAKRIRYAAPAFAVCLAAIIASSAIANAGSAEGVFVLGKSSDGVIVRSGIEYAFIDSSLGSNTFARRAVYECREAGACEIETYVLTHCHPKHVSALFKITGSTVIRRVMIPEEGALSDRETVASIRELCAERGIEFIEYNAEDGIEPLRGVKLIGTGGYKVGRSTHPVISFVLTRGDESVLYLGPSPEERTEKEREAEDDAAVVIFGTHPKAREVTDIPDVPLCIVAPESVPEGAELPESVVVPTRDGDGFGTVAFRFGQNQSEGD